MSRSVRIGERASGVDTIMTDPPIPLLGRAAEAAALRASGIAERERAL